MLCIWGLAIIIVLCYFCEKSKDSMKILFLIGNGFDKNLGLPTSYLEFYDYYFCYIKA